jgi:adenylate cyclase
MSRLLAKILILLGIGLAATGAAEVCQDTRLGRWIELRSYDLRFGFRDSRPEQPEVVLLVIDEESFARIDEPLILWQRHLARVVEGLARADAGCVGIDLLLPDVGRFDPDGHQSMAQALLIAGAEDVPVVLAYRIRKESVEQPAPLLAMTVGPEGFGYVNLTTDTDDDFVRRQELVGYDDEGLPYPAFAYAVAGAYRRGRAEEPPLLPGGESTLLIDFQPGGFPRVPFWRALDAAQSGDDDFLRESFAGRVVLIGVEGEEDLHPTPLYHHPELKDRGQFRRTQGVEIHAHTINTLIEERFLETADLRLRWACTLLISVATVVVAGFLSPWLSAFAAASLLAGYLWVVMVPVFQSGLVLFVVGPVLGSMLAYFGTQTANYLLEGREKRRLRRLFQRYVSSEVIRRLLEQSEQLVLTGERKRVTILFSDIRDFTTRSEGIEPEELVRTLNRYLESMVGVIHRHDGMVDKFIGDAIMAVFGAPIEIPDHAVKAVQTALRMREALADVNQALEGEGLNPFRIGIGIHTGPAIVGNVGSMERMEYTAIGDTVNTASRIEGLTKRFDSEVLVSGETFEELGGRFEAEFLGQEHLKGKSAAVAVYRILATDERG